MTWATGHYMASFARLFVLTLVICCVHAPHALLPVVGLRASQSTPGFLTPNSATFFANRPQHTVHCTRTSLSARTPFIGGNWKCNGTLSSVADIVQMLNQMPESQHDVDVVVAPPSLHVPMVLGSLRGPLQVALQNSSAEKSFGAYTGELSAEMIRDFGIKHVILGHSERRGGFGGQPGESNEVVASKVKIAVDCGLNVIACIGESLEDRAAGSTMIRLGAQLDAIRSKIDESSWSKIVLAYEPIWAIGTGKTATPELAQQTHKDIRTWLETHVSPKVAENVRIIYGGSVKGANAKELFSQPDIDGFLVGGASLTSDFIAIVGSTKG